MCVKWEGDHGLLENEFLSNESNCGGWWSHLHNQSHPFVQFPIVVMIHVYYYYGFLIDENQLKRA